MICPILGFLISKGQFLQYWYFDIDIGNAFGIAAVKLMKVLFSYQWNRSSPFLHTFLSYFEINNSPKN